MEHFVTEQLVVLQGVCGAWVHTSMKKNYGRSIKLEINPKNHVYVTGDRPKNPGSWVTHL